MTMTYMLDTETTGLNVDDGDRIIEIGVVEYDGMTPTGRTYHQRINPGDTQIGAGATAIHGMTNEMLASEPAFAEIANDLLDFIENGELVIYNAPFDLGFLKAECEAADIAWPDCKVIDAFQIARKRFPGGKNTLDVVAKKVGVDVTRRELHGALVDAVILGETYCKLIQQDELVMEQPAAAAPVARGDTLEAIPLNRAICSDGLHLIRSETSYTLFSSALSVASLVSEAKSHGYTSLALTDRYTTAGALGFGDACRKADIKGMIGACIDIAAAPGKPLVFYAANETGWENLQKLITLRNVTNLGEGLTSAQLIDNAEGLVVTSGGRDGAIADIFKREGRDKARRVAEFLSKLYHDRFAFEIDRHGGQRDERGEAITTILADELSLPVIGSLIARAPTGKPELVEVLRSIGSSSQYQPELALGEDLPAPERFEDLFADIPEAITNGGWLADRCDFLPQAAKPMLPRFETGDGSSEKDALHAMARAGLDALLESVPASEHRGYNERFDYEMGLIVGQGFAGYFLIVADFIGWARNKGIPVGPGRGSGAGSIVAWALGITKLDPIKMNLLFERFINPERVSLPDFDIDFCERRREEVIRYVRHKYGEDRVVAIGAYNTFQSRMAVKDVGRILGQSHGLMDKISKALPTSGELTDEIIHSEEIRALLTTPESGEALRLGALLHGLVRNKTRHPAGIVIADRPVEKIASLEPDPNDRQQAVTQYDMKPVEKAGLVKFDFLGLKTLTIIERARVNLTRLGVELDPYEVDLDDAKTLKALSEGRTMGVFQLESGGITQACREIRVDKFEDIVAIVALYRPGPMEFIPLYARRKKGLEPFGTPHPLLDDVARDTYGILIYQEQVMQAAQVLAGYSLGEADILRRAMGKKIQEEMDAQRQVFIDGCWKTNSIPREQAEELFKLIERFASYGFNRSHAAAYGLLSYITAWLANNHPAAYFAAALDGNANDTDQLIRLAQEARKRGIEILPPRIDADGKNFLPVDEKTIRWSLSAIRGIGAGAVDHLVSTFSENPPASLEQLIERCGDRMNRAQTVALAASGALDEIARVERGTIIATVQQSYDGLANEAKAKRAGQISLFGDQPAALQTSRADDVPGEKEVLQMERDALGITITSHPIDAYRRWMEAEGISGPTEAEPLLEHMPLRIAAQVDEAKIIKGGKGFIGLRISDAQTSIEAGCDENLENAHLLQKGAFVVLQVSSYLSTGQRKYRIDTVERLLGEEDKGTSDPILIIETDENFDREQLRSLIAQSPEGEGRLRIIQNKMRTTTPPVVIIDDSFIKQVDSVTGVKSAILA